MGSGCDPVRLAQRCLEAAVPPAEHWKFPRIPRHRYYRYGDCVFVYGWDRGQFGRLVCITIFGPFRPDGSWWQDEVLKRIN